MTRPATPKRYAHPPGRSVPRPGRAKVVAGAIATSAAAVAVMAVVGLPQFLTCCTYTASPGSTTSTSTSSSTTSTTGASTTSTTVPAATYLTPQPQIMLASKFNRSVTGWSVASNSTQLVNGFVYSYTNPYGNVGVNNTRPLYWMPLGQSQVAVGIAGGCSNFQASTGASAPISFGVAGSSSDHILDVEEPAANALWEYWDAVNSGGWTACWGGGTSSLSSFSGIFPNPYGETATGISNAATNITEADINAGVIAHAIGFEQEVSYCNGYTAPANRGDCGSNPTACGTGATCPAEGQYFRFASSVNCASYNATTFEHMVCVAIQTYGMVAIDSGGAEQLIAEAPGDWALQGESGTDPMTTSWGGLAEYQVVAGLPWSSLQALVYVP